MNKKLIKFNDLEKDYLKWYTDYLIFKLRDYDLKKTNESFDYAEAENGLKDSTITNVDDLHKAVRKIANQGVNQLSNLSISIKKFYSYIKEDTESLNLIDENKIDDFINKKCIDENLSYNVRVNYKISLVGLFAYIKSEIKDGFTINLKNIEVIQISEGNRVKNKFVDWMNRSMIKKANKEITKMNFDNEFEKCRNILVFRILLFTGIESNELRTLKEENFIFKNGNMNIKINKTLSREERIIDVHKPYFIKYFNRYKELREFKTNLFFYDEKSPINPIHKDLVTEIVKDILVFAKIKVRDKNPTMLRRSFMLNLHNEKNAITGRTMPKKEIQQLTGIKNTTQLNKILEPNSSDSIAASKHFLDLIN